jgi:uncharacterized protein YjiS (DUF1127 family)
VTFNPYHSIAGWPGTIVGWLQQRRERHLLQALSDRTLADLGLTRPDVESACSVPYRMAIDYAELEARRRLRGPRLTPR